MSLETRAEKAIVEHLRGLLGPAHFRADYPAYLKSPQDNLIDGVSLHDCQADLEQGAGNELKPRGGEPAKFCAARSSAALAVNTFGPFRHARERLTLLGVAGFQKARFECKCPTGLRTRVPPHLDFLAETSDTVVGIESKFLEPWGAAKPAVFSPQYRRLFYGTDRRPAIAETPWRSAYDALSANANLYRHLDAAQLVKHYLGLKHTYAGKTRVLFYLYWEPAKAKDIEEVQTHRKEVADFAERVSGCDTRFVALSYSTFWTDWERTSTWPGMPAHLARLRARYSLPI